MANNQITPQSAFERAAAQVRAQRKPDAVSKPEEKRTSAQIRASLNHIPDTDTLHSMIDKALAALSRGVRWARGSIVNLIV